MKKFDFIIFLTVAVCLTFCLVAGTIRVRHDMHRQIAALEQQIIAIRAGEAWDIYTTEILAVDALPGDGLEDDDEETALAAVPVASLTPSPVPSPVPANVTATVPAASTVR